MTLWGYGELFTTNSVLGWISPFHHELPGKTWFYSWLREGVFAWHYPLNDLGMSLLSDPTISVIYLGSFLYLLDPAVAAKLVLVGHYLLLGFGLYFWTRRQTSSLVAVSVTLMLMSCGILWSLPEHLALGAAAFAPWLLIASENTLRSPNHRTALLTGGLAGMIFILGDPFLVPFLILLSIPAQRMPLKTYLRYVPSFLVAFFVISGANLIEMIQLLPHNARSRGLVAWEVLSYSTNPARIFEMLLPWHSFDFSLGEGFHRQWWFSRLGGGVVLTSCLLVGIAQVRSLAHLRLPLVLLALFFLLAMGQFFPPAAWLMSEVLSFLRFPERFLLYSFFAAIPLITAGLQRLQLYWRQIPLVVFVLISLGENLFPRPVPKLASASLLNTWKERPISRVSVGEVLLPSRVMACQEGADGKTPGTYWDLGAFGVAMVNAESSTHSWGLKSVNCPWALTPPARRWLGFGIMLTAPTTTAMKAQLSEWGWRRQEQTSAGEVWRANDASPLLAHWVSEWTKGEARPPIEGEYFQGSYAINRDSNIQPTCSGNLLMEATPDWQSLRIKIPSGCAGILALPWSYHPNIRLTYHPSQLSSSPLKINDTTIGLVVPLGVEAIQIDFTRPAQTILFIVSVLGQFIILSLVIRGMILRRRTISALTQK